MKYVVAEIEKAVEKGFCIETHVTKGKLICLNEKEVMMNTQLAGDLENRVKEMRGSILTSNQALLKMKIKK